MTKPDAESVIGLGGQVALVTGGGRGIGQAVALALARAGATVAVAARSIDQLAETVAQIESAGGSAHAYPVDVSDLDAVAGCIDDIVGRWGKIDLLVNNAGVGGPIGPVCEIDQAEWWRCLEVNLRGPFLCCRAALPRMIENRSGRIINVASGAGTVGIPNLSAYVVSKTALIRFSEILAAEMRDCGISVFAIQPGTVRTAMAEEAIGSPQAQRWIPWFKELFESGQVVPPDLAARLVVWLATGQADALSGRFIDACDDFYKLIGHSDVIVREDLYALRMRPLGEPRVGPLDETSE